MALPPAHLPIASHDFAYTPANTASTTSTTSSLYSESTVKQDPNLPPRPQMSASRILTNSPPRLPRICISTPDLTNTSWNLEPQEPLSMTPVSSPPLRASQTTKHIPSRNHSDDSIDAIKPLPSLALNTKPPAYHAISNNPNVLANSTEPQQPPNHFYPPRTSSLESKFSQIAPNRTTPPPPVPAKSTHRAPPQPNQISNIPLGVPQHLRNQTPSHTNSSPQLPTSNTKVISTLSTLDIHTHTCDPRVQHALRPEQPVQAHPQAYDTLPTSFYAPRLDSRGQTSRQVQVNSKQGTGFEFLGPADMGTESELGNGRKRKWCIGSRVVWVVVFLFTLIYTIPLLVLSLHTTIRQRSRSQLHPYIPLCLDFVFATALLALSVVRLMRNDRTEDTVPWGYSAEDDRRDHDRVIGIVVGVLGICAGVGMGGCWGGSMIDLEGKSG
ncbi:hypothetical protein FB567DRAFT_598246 [Paraphoma chrysanthemicola]|uniref:Uncharacterized protein n=1 Tax=Paraphoma chrysanthemicola TaxID=798071 RepID=A0A8K0VSK3_9PLEO|nr:hypothetical protein FB567DRAFT_598246 [Paraphoma chrysanthemicola]